MCLGVDSRQRILFCSAILSLSRYAVGQEYTTSDCWFFLIGMQQGWVFSGQNLFFSGTADKTG